MNTAVRLPLSERINIRMIVFAAIVLGAISVPLYVFLDTQLSGGIWQRKDSHGSYKLVDLKTISLFDLDPARAKDADIPERFRALDGQRVMFKGQMYSGNKGVGRQASFDIVYNIAKCCFNGEPRIQHFVKASVLPGHKVTFYNDFVNVIGTLHVGVERGEAGELLSVYRIDVESVEPTT